MDEEKQKKDIIEIVKKVIDNNSTTMNFDDDAEIRIRADSLNLIAETIADEVLGN